MGTATNSYKFIGSTSPKGCVTCDVTGGQRK